MKPFSSKTAGAVTALLQNSALIAKIARFATVGVANGVIYAVVTTIGIAALKMSPVWGSLLGYGAVLPFAFLAHRRFTFRSQGEKLGELVRFVITFISGLLLSLAAMHATTAWFGAHFFVGIVAAIALVPAISLIVFDRWVFVRPAHEPDLP